MGQTYCCGLPAKGSVYLIAIIDIILGLVSVLLSIVALTDVQKVLGPLNLIDSDEDGNVACDIDPATNPISIQSGRDRLARLQGQVILGLLVSLVFLALSLGLFIGVRKDWPWPIKSWLIYGCTLALIGVISILVLAVVSDQFLWLLLLILAVIRVYEIWVVVDYLKHSRFLLLTSLSRSGSTERLHNV